MMKLNYLMKKYLKLPSKPFRKILGKLYNMKIKNDVGIVVVERNGFKIKLDLSDITNNHIYNEIYKIAIVEKIKSELKDGDVAIDIGSHIGYFTLIFSKIVGDNGKVYSFEPVKEVFNMTRNNVEINNFKNIILENKGLSDREEETTADIQYRYDLKCIDDKKTKEVKHFLTTLDDYVEERRIKKINIIKIDTNFFDLKILRGALNTIKRFRPIVIVKTSYEKEHHGEDRMKYYEEFGHFLFSLGGYNVYSDIDGVRKPLNIDKFLKLSKTRGAINVVLKDESRIK